MFILGLQGSPRLNGNTSILLEKLLDEARNLGAATQTIHAAKKNILPCKECGTCERKGFCPIDDDMQGIYPLLWQADLIVLATPIFFYGATAQLKALIDRSQALWSRKYVLGLSDPGRQWRKGTLIAVGATKGKNLFEGVTLTAKYFFDAVGAEFAGELTYKQIESSGDIKAHPTALNDAKEMGQRLTAPFLKRKKILFLCGENACRSQMAGAFARNYAGDRVEALSAGNKPAEEINPIMVEVMHEKTIDMAYLKPKSLESVSFSGKPDLIVSMGCGDRCPNFPGVPIEDWNLEDPAGKPESFMRETRDEIEKRVKQLIDEKC